jgi:hypothetical protein
LLEKYDYSILERWEYHVNYFRGEWQPTVRSPISPETVFLSGFEIGSHYVAQAGFELLILLRQPPECLEYQHTRPKCIFKAIKNCVCVCACVY